MINPIVIIITISIILSVLVICVINKPKRPIISGTVIFVLICYVIMTFILDNAIMGATFNDSFGGFISFLVMSDSPSYDEMSDSFSTFMTIDILLIIASLATFFGEMLLILRKDYRK